MVLYFASASTYRRSVISVSYNPMMSLCLGRHSAMVAFPLYLRLPTPKRTFLHRYLYAFKLYSFIVTYYENMSTIFIRKKIEGGLK